MENYKNTNFTVGRLLHMWWKRLCGAEFEGSDVKCDPVNHRESRTEQELHIL